jgi:Fe-S cluster assembly protein SufD
MNSKPELEIYADDVKCSHGSTTGQMDDQALFFLRARGIGKEKATAILINAFLAEINSQVLCPAIQEILSKDSE